MVVVAAAAAAAGTPPAGGPCPGEAAAAALVVTSASPPICDMYMNMCVVQYESPGHSHTCPFTLAKGVLLFHYIGRFWTDVLPEDPPRPNAIPRQVPHTHGEPTTGLIVRDETLVIETKLVDCCF